MKKIVTILYNDEDEYEGGILTRAETIVETADDISRHLEQFHKIEHALERQIENEINDNLEEK